MHNNKRAYSIYKVILCLALNLFLFGNAVVFAECDPTTGKYEGLLHQLKVPDDVKDWGYCHDFGYGHTSTYKEFKDLQAGYWVYAAPYWYIWKRNATNGPLMCDSTNRGIFRNLLHQLKIPEDSIRYGTCHIYGKWDGTEYKGHKNLNPGYWVYAAPYWYIWGEKVSRK